MIEQLREKGINALLCFISLAVVLFQFLSVYFLGDRTFAVLLLGFFCFVTAAISKKIIQIPLYILGYLYGLFHFFPLNQNFSIGWLTAFVETIFQSLVELRAGRLGYFPDTLSWALILLFSLCLMIMQIRHERWFLSYSLMISYLLMLVVFNRMNLSWQVLIILSCGLLVYLDTHSNKAPPFKEQATPLLFAAVLFAGFTLAAILLPLDFFKSEIIARTTSVRNYFNQEGLYNLIQQYGLPTPAQTGFSENDLALGGPLLDDATILFEAKQEKAHYWRIESKNTYTGKGWQKGSNEEPEFIDGTALSLADPSYQHDFHEPQQIELEFFTQENYLPLPYGKTILTINRGRTGFETFSQSRRANFLQPTENAIITMNWLEPNYQGDDLQEIPIVQPKISDALADFDSQSAASSEDPDNLVEEETSDPISAEDLQLPDTLPERVRDLAIEITADQAALFAKVTAVESYLKDQNEFRYSKMDAEYPTEDQDYVDHFLFESKIGYCDNFSSSMVVLLRSVGIPSRWVKGFASGDRERGSTEEDTKYLIRNSHAHSWVEVYFDGYGWLPFEPTPSFTNPDRPALQLDSPEETFSTNSSSSEAATSSSSQINEQEPEEEKQTETQQNSAFLKKIGELLRFSLWLLLPALILLSVWLCRQYFFYWQILFWLKLGKRPLDRAYPLLLKRAVNQLYRPDAEPLKIYAERFEKDFPNFHGAFIQVSEAYERMMFDKEFRETDTEWLLIKRNAQLFLKIQRAIKKRPQS